MKNNRVNICESTVPLAICTKSMELFKLYSKEKTKFFSLKLLFIKVRCLGNVNKMCVVVRNG